MGQCCTNWNALMHCFLHASEAFLAKRLSFHHKTLPRCSMRYGIEAELDMAGLALLMKLEGCSASLSWSKHPVQIGRMGTVPVRGFQRASSDKLSNSATSQTFRCHERPTKANLEHQQGLAPTPHVGITGLGQGLGEGRKSLHARGWHGALS